MALQNYLLSENVLLLGFLDLNNSEIYDFGIIFTHFVPTWVMIIYTIIVMNGN